MKKFLPYKIDKRETVFYRNGNYYDTDLKIISPKSVNNANSNVLEMLTLGNMNVEDYKRDFDEIVNVLKINDHRYYYKNIIKHVIYSLLPNHKEIEPIEKEEYDFINSNISCAQPRYKTTIPITLSKCKLYDVNSLFPSIFCKPISIPSSKAKFTHVDEIEMKGTEIAYYNLKINFDNNLKYVYQSFKEKKTWYSKQDISAFISYGIDFELKEGINKMYYEKSQRICFKAILDMYKLKNNKNILVKTILKEIHGVMIQREHSEVDDIEEGCFLKHTEIAKRKYWCEYPKFWRIKLIIYPMCRLIMSKYIKMILDDGYRIYRVATDSIMFRSDCEILDALLDDKKIGAFKNEITKKFSPDEYDYNEKYYLQSDLTLSTDKPKPKSEE